MRTGSNLAEIYSKLESLAAHELRGAKIKKFELISFELQECCLSSFQWQPERSLKACSKIYSNEYFTSALRVFFRNGLGDTKTSAKLLGSLFGLPKWAVEDYPKLLFDSN